jgi:hypothetical protein
MTRRAKLSIDTIMTFDVEGQPFVGWVVGTTFDAAGMTYAWRSTSGLGAITRGIPKDAQAVT